MGYLDVHAPVATRSASPAPDPAPARIPTSQTPKVGSRGKGRCEAGRVRAGGVALAVRGAVHKTTVGGEEIDLHLGSKGLRDVEAAVAATGVAWDHMVETTLPDGRVITHYVDSHTIQGRMPRSCPAELRDAVREIVDLRYNMVDGVELTSKERRELESRIAFQLREAGYPSDPAAVWDAASAVVPNAFRPGDRYATEVDLYHLQQMSALSDSEVFARAIAQGLPIIISTDDAGSIISAAAGGVSLYERSGDLRAAALAAHASYRALPITECCFSCRSSVALCSCTSRFTASLSLEESLRRTRTPAAALAADRPAAAGSRWNDAPRRLPDPAATFVEDEEIARAAEVLTLRGGEVWAREDMDARRDIAREAALLCDQYGVTPEELLTPGLSHLLVEDFAAARRSGVAAAADPGVRAAYEALSSASAASEPGAPAAQARARILDRAFRDEVARAGSAPLPAISESSAREGSVAAAAAALTAPAPTATSTATADPVAAPAPTTIRGRLRGWFQSASSPRLRARLADDTSATIALDPRDLTLFASFRAPQVVSPDLSVRPRRTTAPRVVAASPPLPEGIRAQIGAKVPAGTSRRAPTPRSARGSRPLDSSRTAAPAAPVPAPAVTPAPAARTYAGPPRTAAERARELGSDADRPRRAAPAVPRPRVTPPPAPAVTRETPPTLRESLPRPARTTSSDPARITPPPAPAVTRETPPTLMESLPRPARTTSSGPARVERLRQLREDAAPAAFSAAPDLALRGAPVLSQDVASPRSPRRSRQRSTLRTL